MIDRIDLEEIEDDEAQHRADARRVAEQNADSQNDELTHEETKRAAAAAYSQHVRVAAYSERFIRAGTAWALRGVK